MGKQDKPKGTRGAALVRVSDDSKQDRQSQCESIQLWLDQHGLTVQEWYLDAGPRDLPHKRAGFRRMIKDIEAGRWDWVVITAKDRFGMANIWQRGKYICIFRENDCQLWSCLDGELTSDDAVTTILGAVGQAQSGAEQKDKSERALRGQVSRARRGESQGGLPPYGYDWVCAGPDGVERWRIFYTGLFERLKIYPDGRPPERYDGKGNVPARDQGEVLILAPSQDRSRIEWARKIFHWYATEAIPINGIARRLNDLRVPAINGQGWYSSLISKMLRNPAYVEGCPVWNKQGQGRFLELVGGEYRPVEKVKDRVKVGRKRDQADWIYPEGEWEGIIDRDTWGPVQVKLLGTPRPDRAPRNSDLWLAGLLYCGQCGARMAGWHQKNEKQCLSYCCNTYRKYGKNNHTGCRLHRASHQVLAELVSRYLDESQGKIDLVLQCEQEEGVLRALRAEHYSKIRDYLQTLEGMRRFVESYLGETTMEVDGQTYEIMDVTRAYRQVHEQKREEIARELATRDEELRGLARSLGRLTNDIAIGATEREMAAVGEEMKRLQAMLQPLDEKARDLRAELVRCASAVREARESLKGDSNRQRAEALGRVLARIVCHFEHRREKQQDRSVLVRVVFEPLSGEPVAVDLRDGTRRGPGPAAKVDCPLLGRTYGADEIDAVKRGLGQVKDLAHSAQAMLPQILELRQAGKSLTGIGRTLGLSRQAVRRALDGASGQRE